MPKKLIAIFSSAGRSVPISPIQPASGRTRKSARAAKAAASPVSAWNRSAPANAPPRRPPQDKRRALEGRRLPGERLEQVRPGHGSPEQDQEHHHHQALELL